MVSWKNILKMDFSVKPKGVKVSKDGFSDDYIQIARDMEIPFARKTHQKLVSQGNTYAMTYDLDVGKELQEIASAMKTLRIKITFAKLVDEKYNFEDNLDGDGLYEYNVKGGVAAKIEYQGREKILYFMITSEGAYTESGDKPMFHIPRVLEDENVFTDVVLESLNIGEGPSKNPERNDMDDEREEYQKWWDSLNRNEKIESTEAGNPPPHAYGKGAWPPKKDW